MAQAAKFSLEKNTEAEVHAHQANVKRVAFERGFSHFDRHFPKIASVFSLRAAICWTHGEKSGKFAGNRLFPNVSAGNNFLKEIEN